MGIGSSVVAGLLRSPFHAVLSGTTDLIRYTGRRSGRRITTPTQYALRGDEVVIFVGRPETKTWWRNFRSEGEVEVLLRRRWVPMTARAIVGEDEPEVVAPLLDAYLARYPRAVRLLGGATAEDRARAAVLVWCRPR